jgi:hypothetical protein
MSQKELRAGQLLTSYGPGALVDFVDESVIIAGLKFWQYDRNVALPIISEPRLEAELRRRLNMRHVELRLPPSKSEGFGQSTAVVRSFLFPEWVQVQHVVPGKNRAGVFRRRLVQKRHLENGQFRDDNNKKWSVVAVRFVQACAHGHISDIDWNYVLHGKEACQVKRLWLEEGSSSSGIASIKVLCECGAEVNMSDLFKEGAKLGKCWGLRPWLGFGTKEECKEQNKALIRSASNVYYPQTITVISIPETSDPVWDAVGKNWAILQNSTELDQVRVFMTIPQVFADLGMYDIERIFQVIQAKQKGEEPSQSESVKEVEFSTLSQSSHEILHEIPKGDFFARSIPLCDENSFALGKYFEKIVAVHKLREVSGLYGFTRLEPLARDFDGTPDTDSPDIKISQIGIEEEHWAPCIENRGEGIFLRFDSGAIATWKKRTKVHDYESEIKEAFMNSPIGRKSKIPFPGIEYYMAHSFCHALMNTLTLECGYPSSSLKERLYLCREGLGIMIYTASSDAEGTLGGLVLQARELGRFVAQALETSRLCSNDPLCAIHRAGDLDNRPLSGAACHSCLHVPETSCEQWNQYLDRNVIIETLERKGVAFFQ